MRGRIEAEIDDADGEERGSEEGVTRLEVWIFGSFSFNEFLSEFEEVRSVAALMLEVEVIKFPSIMAHMYVSLDI